MTTAPTIGHLSEGMRGGPRVATHLALDAKQVG